MSMLWSLQDVKVLIVDDQIQMRKSISRILNSMGIIHITEASSGIKAFTMIQQNNYDLVITDILMDKMDGYELIELIRKRNVRGDIPIIAVSGESGKDEIVKVNTLGASSYLMKPFSADDFDARVKSALSDYFQPSEPLGSIRSVEIMFQKNSFDSCLELIQILQKKYPDQTKLILLKILVLEKLQRFDEAISIALDGISTNPGYFRFYGALANLYHSKGLFADAALAMSKELEINPKQAGRQVELGFLLMQLNNHQEALKHLQLAIAEKPKHKQALLGAGRAFSMAGDLDKAIYYFQRYRKHHPEDTKPLEAIVDCCIQAKVPKRAEDVLKTYLGGQAVQTDAYILLAKFYFRDQRKAEGIKTLESLLSRAPDSPDALRLLGEVCIDLGHYARAEECLHKAAKMQISEETLILLVKSYSIQKKYIEAIAQLERAILVASQPGTIFVLLGNCFGALGEPRKAMLAYQMAVQSGNHSADCQNAIKGCRTIIENERRGQKAS
jgi:two-component system chemotaxis response regulator CheY